MWITRRVMAILAVIAMFALVGPAPARADGCEGFCRVSLEGRVVQLVADGESTCALTEDGDVYCWGAGYPDPYAPGRNPLLLITIGALLVAGGATLVMLTRPSPTRPRPETPKPPA
ncbi:hypothetical protein ACQPZX_03275 [Actinoplanes sp. CA-142083]|uniref:hypothetical protein n=1 Tax=Actinoplanes sp. CA-142083 TaxID=3239903 RepID=UPI003D908532